MLFDLIKDSTEKSPNDTFELFKERDSATLHKKVLDSFLKSEKLGEASETKYYLNIDSEGVFPSFTMSAINRPIVKNSISLMKLVNEASIKFNKTNITYRMVDKRPFIIVTTSFYFLDDLESLIFTDFSGYESYDGESKESQKAIKKINSIFGSMSIAILEASMFFDEHSINYMDEITSEESKNEGK